MTKGPQSDTRIASSSMRSPTFDPRAKTITAQSDVQQRTTARSPSPTNGKHGAFSIMAVLYRFWHGVIDTSMLLFGYLWLYGQHPLYGM